MDSNGKGDEGNVIPIETAKGASASSKRSKRDPINAILGKRPSGKQLRETLQEKLPAIKAKRIEPKIGRPTKYRPELADDFIKLMANGFTITECCDRLNIDRATVYSYAEKHPPFSHALARAKRALAEHAFSSALSVPKALFERSQSGEVIDGPTVAAARLYTDSLKWYAERLNPHAYAAQSKQSIELTGANGGPIQTASVLIDSRSLSPDAREALRYALLAANAAPIIEGEGVDE